MRGGAALFQNVSVGRLAGPPRAVRLIRERALPGGVERRCRKTQDRAVGKRSVALTRFPVTGNFLAD
jgi:hypothetical protein